MKIIKSSGDNDWEIWFKKFGRGLGATLLGTGVSYAATYIDGNPLPDPKYQFVAGLVVVILLQIGNYLKHR